MWGTTLDPRRRLGLGVFILILVVVIWVFSSELSRIIFSKYKYDKPFFVTYFKTSIFSFWLSGFLCMPSWRRLLCRKNRISPDQPPSRTHSSESLKIDPSELLSEPMFVPTAGEGDADSETDGLVITSINTHVQDSLEVASSEAAEAAEAVGPLPSNDALGQRGRCASELSENHQRSVRFSDFSEIRQMASSHAEHAARSRMSYTASELLEREERRTAALVDGQLPVKLVARLAFVFCLLWFFANYSYSAALIQTVPGVVNVLSSTSSLFTLVLAALLPSSNAEADRFTASKFVCVLLSIGGVALVSFGDKALEQSPLPAGAMWALGSALAYALYLVMLRRQVESEQQLSLAMFFGFVGLFNMFLLWPGMLVLDVTNVELFEMPNGTEWAMIAINGVIGTMVSELLWLWGCFLTSSLLATLALSLTTPLTMLADYLFFKSVYDWRVYVGSVPVFLSFIIVALLSHYDNADPLGHLLCRLRHLLAPQYRSRRPAAPAPYTPRRNTESDSDLSV